MSTRMPLTVTDVRAATGAPEDIEVGRVVLNWMENRIARPHPQVNRPQSGSQVICPFIAWSLKANAISMVFHREYDGSNASMIVKQIEENVLLFKQKNPALNARAEKHKALMIVFPAIRKCSLNVLDRCQKRLKDTLVPQGLMIGQFHEKCREPAVHNKNFRDIMWSPVPILVIRNMLEHDIEFLYNKPAWFKLYDERYGAYFAQPENLHACEQHLLEFYRKGKCKSEKSLVCVD